MEEKLEDLAREFLEEFFRLGRYHHSRQIGNSMKGEAFLLMYLWKKQDCATPGELGKAMRTSSARVAAALNNLERKGQILRKTDEKDRRKIRVELTPKGAEQAREWQQMPIRMVTRLMEELGEADAQQMLHIMKRINEVAPRIEFCEECCEGQKKNDNRGGKDDIEV